MTTEDVVVRVEPTWVVTYSFGHNDTAMRFTAKSDALRLARALKRVIEGENLGASLDGPQAYIHANVRLTKHFPVVPARAEDVEWE